MWSYDYWRRLVGDPHLGAADAGDTMTITNRERAENTDRAIQNLMPQHRIPYIETQIAEAVAEARKETWEAASGEAKSIENDDTDDLGAGEEAISEEYARGYRDAASYLRITLGYFADHDPDRARARATTERGTG